MAQKSHHDPENQESKPPEALRQVGLVLTVVTQKP